ncbi:LysR family transcriptional regulator substrate-binding protein [Nonomuraea sp. 10N515B]|uniref:LysR family transcriptional regulator substrate-binding protein n=1 Tax=Nonomuraea sp. 10N515B TaxID=3457422 RepID=UPI003FCE16E5
MEVFRKTVPVKELRDDGLHVTILYDEPRVLLVTRDHRLARKEHVTLDDIGDEALPRLPDATWDAYWRIDPRPGGSPAPDGPLVEAPEEKFELIAAGQAVAIVSAGLRAETLHPGVTGISWREWSRARSPSPRAQAMTTACSRPSSRPPRPPHGRLAAIRASDPTATPARSPARCGDPAPMRRPWMHGALPVATAAPNRAEGLPAARGWASRNDRTLGSDDDRQRSASLCG